MVIENEYEPAETAQNPASAAAEWTQVLQDPKVRASMLSMGLQLMQPQGFGQTTVGHLAQAIGAGGETLGNIETLDLRDQEQARRERDTDSQIDRRADQSDIAAANAATAGHRAESQRILTESNVNLNTARAATAMANVGRIEAQTEALRLKTELYPQDQAAKIALAQKRQELLAAQAALAGARTEAVAPVAASQVERNQAAAGLSRERTNQAGANTDIARKRLDISERKLTAQEKIADQRGQLQDRRTYETAKQKHNEQQGMEPRGKRTAFPSYTEWLKTYQLPAEAPAAPAAPGATAPASPAATAPASINIADETARAQKWLATPGLSEAKKAAIRATYKQRTGQELP